MLVKELSFRGRPYRISARNNVPSDPTWFTYDDEAVVRERDWTVAPGDVVLDVGAAYGSYAITALVSGASLVHTWNPSQEENGIYAESLFLNGWSNKAVIHSEGLWSRPGHLVEENLSFSESEPRPGSFPVRTLDSYDLGLTHIDWMKLDVEGAETEVLSGGLRLISAFRPKIVVEHHQFKDPTLESRVSNFLSSLDYETVRVTPYHGVSHGLYVPRS